MNLLLFLFFFYTISISISIGVATKYKMYKKTNGYDQRPNITEPPAQLYRITKYLEKKQLLDTLENTQIPIHLKIRLLEKSVKPPNLFAGGLMKEFCFDMEEDKKSIEN